MRHEGSPVKALPFSRRRMTPLAVVQNSYASLKGSREFTKRKAEDNARERTIIARTSQFLERSHSVKARFEEL